MNGEDAESPGIENLVDLIDGLIEPSEPAPVPLTPETWGWAALAVIAVAVIAWLVRSQIAHRRVNAYRRAALAELAEATTAAQVATILRRAALAAWPRKDVAGLTGAEWITFLDRTGAEDLPEAAERELVTALWQGGGAEASPEFRRAAEGWLRTHRRERPPEPRVQHEKAGA